MNPVPNTAVFSFFIVSFPLRTGRSRTHTVSQKNARVVAIMLLRIRFGRGRQIQRRKGKNRRLALAFGALLTPAAVMASVLGLWRLAADYSPTGRSGWLPPLCCSPSPGPSTGMAAITIEPDPDILIS